jgi:hypothetical protein
MASVLEVVLRVAHAFEALGIAYVIVGSFASSARGKARATADVDLVADLAPERVRAVVDALSSEFYIDEASVRRAVTTHRSFNAIHLDSMFKVDVFIAPGHGFRREQLDHRLRERVGQGEQDVLYIATAEDTILAKLDWYRRGGETSDWGLDIFRCKAGEEKT